MRVPLIDHLHNMALMYAYDSEYYDSVASSNTPELAEKIRTNGLFLLNKLVPYLRAHEEISDKSVTVHVLFDKAICRDRIMEGKILDRFR